MSANSPADLARETLRRAVELQVLETDDVSSAGSLLQDPRELIQALRDARAFPEKVENAIKKLIELRPGGARRPAAGTARQAAEAPGRVHLEASSGTVAPAREAAAPKAPLAKAPPERDEGSATVVPLGKSGGAARSSVALGDGGSTMAPARGGDEKALLGGGRPRVASPEDLLDLQALDPVNRRAIESAAFCRIALRLGKVTRDRVALALENENPEEDLLHSGAIDQDAVMEILASRTNLRVACGNCFGVLPPMHDPSRGCPICGQVASTAGGRFATSATMTDGQLQGIEGFPGQGGTFAGYELIERIAEGGMGVVFKARQTKLNRVVALKVMRGGSLANKERRRRFRQEAESAAALRHPCIVPVHEIDEVAGYPFYTMEFIEGVTMDRYVAEKKLEPRKVSALVRGIADAVQHFHLRGIIHRDLKPGNILVGEDGVPKIIDFGIAKKLVPDSDSSTIEGEVLGTPYYMSPEQATGRVTEVDTRTDVYALGAILYELLTGAPPWKGLRQARLIAAIQEEDPEPIRVTNPAVEQDLESIVFKAMSKERERRYQSAFDLMGDLERYEKNMPVTARPATIVYRLKKYVRRRLPAVIGTGVFIFMLGIVGTAVGFQAAEKRLEVARLLADATNETLEVDARESKVAEALGKDPGNPDALKVKAELKAARELAERQRVLDQQAKDLSAQKALDEAQKKAERAQEDARKKTEEEARTRAEKRAQDLLAEANGKTSVLDAIPDLQEALVVVPKDSNDLRVRIENKKIDLELALAKENVARNQSGLARFWLGDARRLEAAQARKPELDEVEGDLRKLESGEEELKAAHELVTQGKMLAAKAKLEQLKQLKVDPARFAADSLTVHDACTQRAAVLASEGRTLLEKQGDPVNGRVKALEARQYDDSEPVRALLADCERADVLDARKKAALDWKRPESQQTALVVLSQAAERVQDPELRGLLETERKARAALLSERALAGLSFVPAVAALDIHAVYIQTREVTNAEWKEFVDQGGKPPRAWTNGSYGDPANADRPVRGVSFPEARAFAAWKSRATGGAWRLPTEKEWEVAAGFDPQTQRVSLYPWGDEWNSRTIALATDLPRPAGATPGDVSALGLLDAAGNVMEWVDRNGHPGTKGASFAASEAVAKRFALVRNTGTPGDDPPPELLEWVGLRLVRGIEEKP